MHTDQSSLSWHIILGGFIVILTVFFFLTKKRTKGNLPPQVKGHYLRGYEPALHPRAFLGFMKLKRDHPDIVTVHIGFRKYIFLMSHSAMVQTLINKADNFAGRPQNDIIEIITRKQGIIFMDGPLWKNHRRFALRVLRDFGFGRNLSEEIIHTEVQNLITFIDKRRQTEKEGINTLELLLRSVSNVICTLTMGEQPGYEDEVFGDIVNRMKMNTGTCEFKSPFTMFPFLINFLPLMQKLSPKTQSLLENSRVVGNYIESKIQKHLQEFDPNQEPRDYIDSFLLEQHKEDKHSAESGLLHTFTSQQLRREIIEFFVAGTDTTSNSLCWTLLLMALHPEVQRKCHEEIDAVIEGRLPSLKDKQSTPYIQAVLDEAQRFTTLVPMSLTHRCFEETEVFGYTIPANSLIVPFIYGVHHDAKVWDKPFEFYPQHFLTQDGWHYQPRDELVTFSVGKRSCLGESLAKVELYVFFVSLLQRYKVSLNVEDKKRVDEILLGTEGTIHAPGEHRILFESRE